MTPHEFQSKPAESPQSAALAASQTSLATDAEPDLDDSQLDFHLFNYLTTRAKRARRQRLRLLILATSLFVTLPCLAMLFAKGYEARLFPLLLAPAFSLYALLSLMMAHWPKEERPLSGAELARVGGVKAIPALFAASSADTPVVEIRASRAALALLLPRIQEKDAYLLTGNARRTIQKWLKGVSDYPVISEDFDALRLAALKALTQAGHSSDIPAVALLAEMPTRTTSAAALKQAAMECLTALKSRSEEDHAKRTLLRASQLEGANPDTLLRPASYSTETNPAELYAVRVCPMRGGEYKRIQAASGP